MKKASNCFLMASLGLLLPECSSFQPTRQDLRISDRTLSPITHDSYSAPMLPYSSYTSTTRIYGAANGSEVSWNPAQASEFLVWNADDAEKVGRQLAPMIQHWGGNDVGEFLTRMYLGEVNQQDYTISYCPSNVRNPQWLGLGEDGLRFITLLFREALPPQTLEAPEITRFAQYFLLKEHKWPSTENNNNNNNGATGGDSMFETDTFLNRGHGPNIAKVFGYLRRERLGDFDAQDVIHLVSLEEQPNKNQLILQLGDFFGNLGIQLTSMEKIMTVEGLAMKGCSPGLIARLVSTIEEIGEDVRLASVEKSKALREAAGVTKQQPSTQVVVNGKSKSREWMSESISEPIKTPYKEIVTEEFESAGIGDFEARWLPEELLEEETTSSSQ